VSKSGSIPFLQGRLLLTPELVPADLFSRVAVRTSGYPGAGIAEMSLAAKFPPGSSVSARGATALSPCGGQADGRIQRTYAPWDPIYKDHDTDGEAGNRLAAARSRPLGHLQVSDSVAACRDTSRRPLAEVAGSVPDLYPAERWRLT
jgi:hypothetical protein